MPEMTPIDAFAQFAKHSPNKIAFQSNDALISYGQGYSQIKKFAAFLESRGIKPGDLVLTIVPPRIDWYLIMALHSIGATSCTGHAQIPSSIKFDWIINTKPSPAFPMKNQIVIDEGFISSVGKSQERDETPNRDPEHLVRLVLTSGTTGYSKAVPMHLGSLRSRHDRNQAASPVGSELTVTLMGLGSISGGNRVLYNAWSGSYFVTPANRGDWTAWVELVSKVQPFQLSGSPVQLESFFATARRMGARFDFLRRISSAGTVFPSVLAERIGTLTSAPIVSVYGSTEAGQVASAHVESGHNPFEIGEIQEGVEYQIVDDAGNVLPDGIVGNLRVKTPAMANEYFCDPLSTTKFFKDGWFYPGDEAFVAKSGRVTLSGRTSEFVNAGGVKIDPTQVDQAILRLPNLLDGAAFGVENSSGVVMLALGYVPDSGFEAKSSLEVLRKRLNGKHPIVAYEVAQIPRNEMGKVMRFQLSDMFKGSKPDAAI